MIKKVILYDNTAHVCHITVVVLPSTVTMTLKSSTISVARMTIG